MEYRPSKGAASASRDGTTAKDFDTLVPALPNRLLLPGEQLSFTFRHDGSRHDSKAPGVEF